MVEKDCKLCNYFKNCFKSYQILTRALFNKYSQSQDYFYGKIVEKFIQSESNKNVISFKDQIFYDDDEEYLKKVYHLPHLNKKIKDLIEYYKYHTEIPRVYMLPISLVCNYFHDKKRRINYYKIKLLLHQQNGNQDRLQVTSSSISSSEISSEPSNSQFFMTKFLNPHILKSFTFIKEKQKDTIQEMNAILQNLSKLNLKDVEQYSYFLMDTQISDQSISFKQGFQDKLIKIKQFFSQLQQQKATKIKFKQKPVPSQQPVKKIQENITKQLVKQKSIQNLIQNNQLGKQINNFNLQNQPVQSTRNQYDLKQTKKKQNNFRTQSEMNVNTLFTPQVNKGAVIDFKILDQKQSQNKLVRPSSNDKKTNNLVKQYKKQSLDLKNLKQKDVKTLVSPQNNFVTPQTKDTKNLFRNRQKNPQSMQITNEFLIKVNKQYEGEKLNAIIQQFKDSQSHRSQEKYKNLQLKIKLI